jgi:hypothetical protein
MSNEGIHRDGLQWAVMRGNRFRVCERTVDRLPAGAYICTMDEGGMCVFEQRELEVDDLIDFPGSLAAQVLEEIERFWTLGDRFRHYGFLHRRGYLLHGKQGSGKSSLLHLVIARAVAKGHVAFFCESPGAFAQCVSQFRCMDPDRPMLCMFEDIDAIIRHYGDGVLLQWLDGHLQVNKAVSLATTNYPERLDRRITARPRRFDRVLCIDAPDDALRDAYFARKLPDLSAAKRKRWVKLSESLSFAALAELIISVCCLDKDLAETAALLKDLESRQPSSDDHASEHAPHRHRSHWQSSDDIPIPF